MASGLPMNFKTAWECAYYHKSMGFDDMVQQAFAQHGLYYSPDKVYPTELSLKKPVRKFEDFKGLKLRSSGILQVYLTSLGAAGMMLPGSEIYAALTLGRGGRRPLGRGAGQRQHGLLRSEQVPPAPGPQRGGHGHLADQHKAMEALPADVQTIVKNTLDEHFWLRTKEYEQLEEKTLAKVQKEKGVELITLGDADVKKMETAALVTWEDVAKRSPDCAKAVQMLKDFHATDRSQEVQKLKAAH